MIVDGVLVGLLMLLACAYVWLRVAEGRTARRRDGRRLGRRHRD
ncbi:hypothetical protein [Azospirillum cavernae]|nr:hypothetical protein [Azospirillum cavernae]